MRALALIVATLLMTTSPAAAQTLRGRVTQPSGLGVAGVVILLIDSAGNIASRALSDGLGDYRMSAPRSGSYRVRTMRIGYHPTSFVAVKLDAGVTFEQSLDVTALPLALDTVHVTAEARCAPYAGESLIASAWEQARAALAATDLTFGNRLLQATVVRTVRTLEPFSDRVLQQTARELSGLVTQPW
jgi:hypothetical protein